MARTVPSQLGFNVRKPYLTAAEDEDERAAGRRQGPREEGPEGRLRDRTVPLQHFNTIKRQP